MPRLLAGQRALDVESEGATLADVARALAAVCPALRGPVIGPDDWLVSGYQFAIRDRFTREPSAVVAEGEAVLLVASSAGG